MICVKLAVYLGYGVAIWVWLGEKARGLALETLHKCHVRKPREKPCGRLANRLDIPNI